MRTLTIAVDDAVFEQLLREGPTPEEAAQRKLAEAVVPTSAWEELEAGFGSTGTGQNLSDTVDQCLYRDGR